MAQHRILNDFSCFIRSPDSSSTSGLGCTDYEQNMVRRGLSLIELMVVLAILAIMIGLILPAIMKIRESAQRAQCQNHLKQMVLAFHHYHHTQGRFPDGGKNGADPPASHPLMTHRPSQRSEWSWTYQILPFLEQSSLYDHPDDATIQSTPVALFYCPSRRQPQTYFGLAKVDFAGCAGTDPHGANGMIVRQGLPRVRMTDVTDGLSQTIALGEKRLKLQKFGFSYDDNESYVSPGWESEIVRWAKADHDRPPSDCGPSRDIVKINPMHFPDHFSGLDQFGSSHPSGCNFAMGDGSVRIIRYQPNPLIFQKLTVRNDGEAVNPNNL